MSVEREMSERYYNVAGGVWGENYWKRISPSLVIAIGGGEDFTSVPDEHTPVRVTLFYDVAYSYDVNSGEAPEVDEFSCMTFDNLQEALVFLDFFERHVK